VPHKLERRLENGHTVHGTPRQAPMDDWDDIIDDLAV
jgi:hypothetical protein